MKINIYLFLFCLIFICVGTREILFGKNMYFLDVEVSLAVTAEQIDGKNFLIRKLRIGIIAESLAIEAQRGLIDITDIHIQTY